MQNNFLFGLDMEILVGVVTIGKRKAKRNCRLLAVERLVAGPSERMITLIIISLS